MVSLSSIDLIMTNNDPFFFVALERKLRNQQNKTHQPATSKRLVPQEKKKEVFTVLMDGISVSEFRSFGRWLNLENVNRLHF